MKDGYRERKKNPPIQRILRSYRNMANKSAQQQFVSRTYQRWENALAKFLVVESVTLESSILAA